jgi:hypothetical protein
MKRQFFDDVLRGEDHAIIVSYNFNREWWRRWLASYSQISMEPIWYNGEM